MADEKKGIVRFGVDTDGSITTGANSTISKDESITENFNATNGGTINVKTTVAVEKEKGEQRRKDIEFICEKLNENTLAAKMQKRLASFENNLDGITGINKQKDDDSLSK